MRAARGAGVGRRLQFHLVGLLFVCWEIGQRGVVCNTCLPHDALLCDLGKPVDLPLPRHTHSLAWACTHIPHPNRGPFVSVLYKLRSEKALGSLDRTLQINWERDVEETSPGSFLLHALLRGKMAQAP